MIKIAAMIGSPDLESDTLAVYSGDFKGAFEKTALHGYEGVELMMKDPKKLDGKMIKQLLTDTNLELVGLCTGHVYGEDKLGLVGYDPDVCSRAEQRLKDFIDFAGEYFGPGTFVNIGRSRGMGFKDDSDRTLEEMKSAFRELGEYARASGVRLILEPITSKETNFINSTQDGIRMVDEVNHENFGLMLDTYHMNIEDDDILESIRQAGDRCWFLHFSDSNRQYPGSGNIDFEKVIDTLKEIRFSGYVSMEIAPLPDPDTAARSAISFLRQYIPKS
ncbi:MAG: sugar phosphate isomerase/epimerase [Spirochaetota bacterium]|nr:MAG: sugar phosphate isomerase/epimerase [Spirochaetota bacterium]